MIKMDKRKIQISGETWLKLNAMKKPGEAFDDVLQRIISEVTENEK